MKLKYIFLSVISVVFILLLIFLFTSNSNEYNPDGFELNISESILPNVSVYVLDNNKKVITTIDENEFFFIQQRGLPPGTVYSFRVVGEHGEVLKPAFVKYTARDVDLDWIETNDHYHQIRPGNQTVELLTIKDDIGTIVARTQLSVLNFDKIIRDTCSYLISEPDVDENGWSRESKIAECVANIAVEFNRVDVCKRLYGIFNITNSDNCIQNYAIATNDTSTCDLMSMPKSKGFCKAKVTNNWIECKKISCDLSCAIESLETQQDLCIQWYAIENRNVSLCNEIKSQDLKTICLDFTTGS